MIFQVAYAFKLNRAELHAAGPEQGRHSFGSRGHFKQEVIETMPSVPRDKLPESTLSLFRDGYEFISKRCERLGSDIFQARLMLQKTICMRGPEAAKLFYDRHLFQRRDGAPLRLQKTLFGRGGVQGMDGEAHRHRKAMFMSLMSSESIDSLARIMSDEWRAALPKWAAQGRIVLLDAAREVLCRAVCAWAGVPLKESEVRRRTQDFAAMIDDSGAVGPRHWQGRLARKRAEGWIGRIIEAVRTGRLDAAEGSALRTVAFHRELDGRLLETRIAAVELINVLRPTVAVARFITFAALALYEYPDWRRRLARAEGRNLELFVQEVRRFYPFFPFVAARVSKPFDWQGYHFPAGARALLDLYGTDHDPRVWDDPEAFRPERFLTWDGSPFNFISQGGGDHYEDHRCPGEWITIELMKTAVHLLATSMDYTVPEQDLTISLSRMPARPESGFVIADVRPRELFV